MMMRRIFHAKAQRANKRQRQSMPFLCRYIGDTFLFIFLFIFNLTAFSQQKKTIFLSETKAQKEQRMKWWEDARFGLFIHWGLCSVPAGEWRGDTTHAE